MADTSEPQPDPVQGEEEKTGKSDGKKTSFPKRYIVAIMIFLGICVQYALRVNLSVAIGAMCNNHTVEQNGFTIKKVRVLLALQSLLSSGAYVSFERLIFNVYM